MSDEFYGAAPLQQSRHVAPGTHAQPMVAVSPVVPMSNVTIVGAVAALGGVLMMAGAWAKWLSMGFASFNIKVSGLFIGLDGRYVLVMGVAALLTGAVAVLWQSNRSVRQVCAGILVAIGAVGLGIVIHEWSTISHASRAVNSLADGFGANSSLAGGESFGSLFSFHVAKGWGLVIDGLACTVAGLTGVALFAL